MGLVDELLVDGVLESGSSRLLNERENVQADERGRVQYCLTLVLGEVRRHGDHTVVNLLIVVKHLSQLARVVQNHSIDLLGSQILNVVKPRSLRELHRPRVPFVQLEFVRELQLFKLLGEIALRSLAEHTIHSLEHVLGFPSTQIQSIVPIIASTVIEGNCRRRLSLATHICHYFEWGTRSDNSNLHVLSTEVNTQNRSIHNSNDDGKKENQFFPTHSHSSFCL